MFFFPKFYGYQMSEKDTVKISTNQIAGNGSAEIPRRERGNYKPTGYKPLMYV